MGSGGRRGHWAVLAGLSVAVVVLALVSAGLGAYRLAPAEVVRGVLEQAHLRMGPRLSLTDHAVLWDIRLPRIALATLVGAALGSAGALLQGAFRNPLAEPAVIGVSGGSALGAVVAVALGAPAVGGWAVPAAAFAAGIATTAFVHRFAIASGRTEMLTLVLTGIAVNAFTGAAISLVAFATRDSASISFWTLGSLSGASWPAVAAVAPLAVVGLAMAPRMAGSLDLLALGDRQASHLGVDVDRLRLVAVVLVALLTAGSVASAGIVGFVGLVVPHLVRLVVGPEHRTLLPASALGGAAAVLLADLVARTALSPTELPLGVLTALAGGPFFLWLLGATRRRSGGWA